MPGSNYENLKTLNKNGHFPPHIIMERMLDIKNSYKHHVDNVMFTNSFTPVCLLSSLPLDLQEAIITCDEVKVKRPWNCGQQGYFPNGQEI